MRELSPEIPSSMHPTSVMPPMQNSIVDLMNAPPSFSPSLDENLENLSWRLRDSPSRAPRASEIKTLMGSFMSTIIRMLMAIVKRPKTVTMLVWALDEALLPTSKPREEPTATQIVLKMVPVNSMHTSYICVIKSRGKKSGF